MDKKKVLVIDDEPNVVRVLFARLKTAGYEVCSALDPLQGVITARKEKPDVILLDLNMPAGGGGTAFENLRSSSHTSLIPIIIISALPPETAERIAQNLGAEGFLPKPFDSKQLLAVIKEVLGE